MGRRPSTRPTDAELEILQILWEKGPCTVREVLESLTEIRPTGYTTALKLLQIMADKGIVTRDEERKSHVYAPAQPKEDTQTKLLHDLAKRAFAGSVPSMALHLIRSTTATETERAEMRVLVDKMSGEP